MRDLINAKVIVSLGSKFFMLCLLGWVRKLEDLDPRREVLSKVPSPSQGEGSLCHLDYEPWERKLAQISSTVGPNGFLLLSKSFYLLPYFGLGLSLKLVSWSLDWVYIHQCNYKVLNLIFNILFKTKSQVITYLFILFYFFVITKPWSVFSRRTIVTIDPGKAQT